MSGNYHVHLRYQSQSTEVKYIDNLKQNINTHRMLLKNKLIEGKHYMLA